LLLLLLLLRICVGEGLGVVLRLVLSVAHDCWHMVRCGGDMLEGNTNMSYADTNVKTGNCRGTVPLITPATWTEVVQGMCYDESWSSGGDRHWKVGRVTCMKIAILSCVLRGTEDSCGFMGACAGC
jgi:hypothetical protein